MTFIEILILLVVTIVNFAVMGLVYSRNPKSATHRLFAFEAFVINLYLIANVISLNVTSDIQALWAIRAVMFFAAPTSVIFFLLVHTFPRSSIAMSKRAFWGWIVLLLCTMALTLTPYVFSSATLVEDGPPSPVPAPGMALFALVGVGTIPLGFYYLLRKRRQAQGVERIQLNFLLLGVSLMFAAIIFLIFVGTVILGNSIFAQYAPIFTVPFVGLTAYTIIRHRLMDIRGALFRTLSLTLLIGIVLLIYGLLAIFALPILADLMDIRGEILAGALALMSLPVARIVRDYLARITDKFFFKDRVNYQQALVGLSQDLSATIQIEEVTAIVLRTMREIMRSQKTVILLEENEGGGFVPHVAEGMKNFQVVIQPDNVILEHLRHAETAIIKDDLPLLKEQNTSLTHAKEIQVVEETMNWLDVSVIMPLFVNKKLTGIILLGDKLSGEPYLKDDMDFLSAFAPLAAVALENAQLYMESLQFGNKLKLEVERATHELEVANEQLKDLDKAKSEFLSIASHQLRTPLTALRGYVSMLIEGDFGQVPEKQMPILDILSKSATRLIELINSLLDISRIESGRLELNLESVDVSQMVNELVADLLPNAMAKGLQLEFHKPSGDELPTKVVADAQRLRQVMLNFIDNSIKYTNQGKVDVYVKRENDKVIFLVQDTGKGISKEDLTLLFNKFSRVGGAARYHTEGTGLGLYVAKQIVKEHHGDISADSPGEGKGSTFSVFLPAEDAPNSLKIGEKVSVTIKAAEATGAGE